MSKTNSNAIYVMQRDVVRFQQAVHEAISLMRQKYAALDLEWQDDKYQAVGDALASVERRIQTVDTDLELLQARLLRMYEAVRAYEETRIGS